MKDLTVLTDDIKAVLASLNYDSFLSEFKCLSENLDNRILIEIERANEQFLVNLYFSEEIPADKAKTGFHSRVENIKKSFTTENMLSSCGWIDVTSEKVSTSEQIFIEKISLTGERR